MATDLVLEEETICLLRDKYVLLNLRKGCTLSELTEDRILSIYQRLLSVIDSAYNNSEESCKNSIHAKHVHKCFHLLEMGHLVSKVDLLFDCKLIPRIISFLDDKISSRYAASTSQRIRDVIKLEQKQITQNNNKTERRNVTFSKKNENIESQPFDPEASCQMHWIKNCTGQSSPIAPPADFYTDIPLGRQIPRTPIKGNDIKENYISIPDYDVSDHSNNDFENNNSENAFYSDSDDCIPSLQMKSTELVRNTRFNTYTVDSTYDIINESYTANSNDWALPVSPLFQNTCNTIRRKTFVVSKPVFGDNDLTNSVLDNSEMANSSGGDDASKTLCFESSVESFLFDVSAIPPPPEFCSFNENNQTICKDLLCMQLEAEASEVKKASSKILSKSKECEKNFDVKDIFSKDRFLEDSMKSVVQENVDEMCFEESEADIKAISNEHSNFNPKQTQKLSVNDYKSGTNDNFDDDCKLKPMQILNLNDQENSKSMDLENTGNELDVKDISDRDGKPKQSKKFVVKEIVDKMQSSDNKLEKNPITHKDSDTDKKQTQWSRVKKNIHDNISNRKENLDENLALKPTQIQTLRSMQNVKTVDLANTGNKLDVNDISDMGRKPEKSRKLLDEVNIDQADVRNSKVGKKAISIKDSNLDKNLTQKSRAIKKVNDKSTTKEYLDEICIQKPKQISILENKANFNKDLANTGDELDVKEISDKDRKPKKSQKLVEENIDQIGIRDCEVDMKAVSLRGSDSDKERTHKSKVQKTVNDESNTKENLDENRILRSTQIHMLENFKNTDFTSADDEFDVKHNLDNDREHVQSLLEKNYNNVVLADVKGTDSDVKSTLHKDSDLTKRQSRVSRVKKGANTGDLSNVDVKSKLNKSVFSKLKSTKKSNICKIFDNEDQANVSTSASENKIAADDVPVRRSTRAALRKAMDAIKILAKSDD